MRFAILTSIAFLSSSSVATLAGYVDKCHGGSTCCSNPSAARLLHQQNCTPDKVCCEEKKQPKFETSTKLRCGKSNVKASTVTAKVSPCHSDATQDCLHVHYAPFADGTQYSEYHLQLSTNPITSSVLDKFSYTEFCQFGKDNHFIDCYVPLSKLASSVYGDAATDYCNKPPLYMAAHGVADKETCWAGDTPISQESKNWAKYFGADFQDCETVCKEECECKCPPPQSPPAEKKKFCEKGTGFAFNPECGKKGGDCAHQLKKLDCAGNRWGWFFELSKDTKKYGYDLIEGAGGNDYSKGTNTGSVHVYVHGNFVDVEYRMKSGYAINVAHTNLSCSKPTKCAPGQYSHNSGCLGNKESYSTSLSKNHCIGDKVYLIFHAEVTEMKDASDSCAAKSCAA